MAPKSKWGDALYTIQTGNDYAFIATVSGRDRWALEELIKAGPKGCTPITNPAPRWAAYVFNLRGLGIPIETHTETHEGPFSGTHARYELLAAVTCIEGEAAA
jgi:hypothetical protein